MDKLLYLLPILACPIMMGGMMWFMMRGNNTNTAAASAQPDPGTQEEIAALRAEIATLRAAQPTSPDEPVWAGGSVQAGWDHTVQDHTVHDHTVQGSSA